MNRPPRGARRKYGRVECTNRCLARFVIHRVSAPKEKRVHVRAHHVDRRYLRVASCVALFSFRFHWTRTVRR